VGPGGVGKTTIAAALGVLGARAGRRTLVCTIDPAPRLADALGIPQLGDEPIALSASAAEALDTHPGTLLAARLDIERTFARLVEAQVSVDETRRRIFVNPIYRQITTALTGSQEYAAMLALAELAGRLDSKHDLVVVDTPPTAHALDFLDAPRRLAAAIESPVVKWFARPPAASGSLSWRRLRAGPALLLRRLGKLVGSHFLDDIGAFLLDFREVLDGFLDRARSVETRLRQPDVGFLVALSPDATTTGEALSFAGQLASAGLPLRGFVANRVLPAPGLTDARDIRGRLEGLATLGGVEAATLDAASAALAETAAYVNGLARAQRIELARLTREAPEVHVTTLPMLPRDVATLASLRAIADKLAAA
jgi:anion-transporting  ArsA/GET3 family ATPase